MAPPNRLLARTVPWLPHQLPAPVALTSMYLLGLAWLDRRRDSQPDACAGTTTSVAASSDSTKATAALRDLVIRLPPSSTTNGVGRCRAGVAETLKGRCPGCRKAQGPCLTEPPVGIEPTTCEAIARSRN